MASITYDVQKQIKAIEKTPPIHTFLYDTFVQNEGAVLAEDAYWDYRKNGVAMAPFVTPGAGGKTLERDTFETLGMTFPTIAPERIVVHKDYAEQRSFGEEVYGSLDPKSRLARIMAKDLADLRYSIQMRKEWMTAQVLFNGQLDIVEYLDGGLTAKTVRQAQFNFTNKYIPDKKWGEAGYSVYDTFRAMGDMVHEGNGTVSIAVFGPEVRSFIEKDPELLKMLDTRNAYFGRIEPGKTDLQRGTEHIGTLSNGVELYCYMGQYRETLKGAAANYIPKGKILVGSPKLLRAMFGPVAQVEKEGELPKIYAKEEVPFRYSKTGGDSVMQRLTSRPAIIPYDVDAWAIGTVL